MQNSASLFSICIAICIRPWGNEAWGLGRFCDAEAMQKRCRCDADQEGALHRSSASYLHRFRCRSSDAEAGRNLHHNHLHRDLHPDRDADRDADAYDVRCDADYTTYSMQILRVRYVYAGRAPHHMRALWMYVLSGRDAHYGRASQASNSSCRSSLTSHKRATIHVARQARGGSTGGRDHRRGCGTTRPSQRRLRFASFFFFSIMFWAWV